jgi:hypothetical protein
MEKKVRIVLGFLVGMVFVDWDIDYFFLQELGITPYYIRIMVKLIGFIGALLCGLTLLFDAWRAIRSS